MMYENLDRRRKRQRAKIIRIILVVIFSTGLIYSIINIYLSKVDVDKAKKMTINYPESIGKLDGNNFARLAKTNPEIEGWLYVKGTKINYAFVKHTDNKFYLNHSLDKTPNRAGWVFMDYRNNIDVLGRNTIIYGHGFFKDIMFGTLKNVLTKSWYDNSENQIIMIKTKSNLTLWQVFSVYDIKTTSDYLLTSFKNDEEYKSFLKMVKKRSLRQFDVELNSEDKILTLSTCFNKSERVVLHAKLIKKTDYSGQD